MSYQHIIGLIAAVMVVFSAGSIMAQQPPEGFQELYEEYGMLSQELRSTQQLALQDPDMVRESEEFSEFIDLKLKEQGAEIAELVDERNKIIEGIEEARERQDQEAEVELQPQYQQLSQQLQPHIELVFEDEAVLEKQQKLEAMMIEKMSQIDPETEQKMERLEEIAEELQKLME